MKRILMTMAVVLALGFGAMAQERNGLFNMGPTSSEDGFFTSGNRDESLLNLPTTHGSDSDVTAPLGSGVAVLLGLGAAYLVTKKRNQE